MTESIATKIDPSLLSQPSTDDDAEICMDVNKLNLFYGEAQALTDISFQMKKNRVTAFIGPSGCGKSTLLRCFNRMNDLVPGAHITGRVGYHGVDLYDDKVDAVEVRRRIGMVFQKPNPFPKSIYDNVAYGRRIHGLHGRLDKGNALALYLALFQLLILNQVVEDDDALIERAGFVLHLIDAVGQSDQAEDEADIDETQHGYSQRVNSYALPLTWLSRPNSAPAAPPAPQDRADGRPPPYAPRL